MGVISTQNITYRLIANGQQLDVFSDEDLKLSNNVTGLFDVGTLPADFTRQITLPGTKVNNAFFEHVYDISIDNPFLFATNIKVPAYLDFNGIYLINGYLQLNKVNLYQNKAIDSYEVTVYGTLSSFARQCNNTYLTSLTNLTKFNHTASYDNISSSWAGTLFSGSIVYPMADYGNAWSFGYDRALNQINTNEGAMNTMDFKPAIRMIDVWDAIFEFTGYTYSSSFLSQNFINDIYLVANNALKYPEFATIDLETYGNIKISAISGSGMTDLNLPDNTITQLPWYSVQTDPQSFIGTNGSYRVDINTRLEGTLKLALNVSASNGNLPGQIDLWYWQTGSAATSGTYTTLTNFNNFFTETAQSRSGSIDYTYDISTEFYTSVLTPGYYYFGLKPSKYYASAAPTLTLDKGSNPKSYLTISKVRQAADNKIIDIPSNLPFGTTGIKLIDFLTSVQRKFHLVMYPDNTKQNHFIIETFNTWYKRGVVKSFDNFIDLNKKIEVIPANNFAVNKLNFGDTLDGDYISQQFNKAANREYAKSYYVDTTNFYSQGTYEVKTTLASSPLYYIPGTGLSGSIAGYTPPVNSYLWNLGGVGYNWSNTGYACSGTYYYPTAVYADAQNAYAIVQFFEDANLTIPFDGGGYAYKFYRTGGGAAYFAATIDSSGYLDNTTYCGG